MSAVSNRNQRDALSETQFRALNLASVHPSNLNALFTEINVRYLSEVQLASLNSEQLVGVFTGSQYNQIQRDVLSETQFQALNLAGMEPAKLDLLLTTGNVRRLSESQLSSLSSAQLVGVFTGAEHNRRQRDALSRTQFQALHLDGVRSVKLSELITEERVEDLSLEQLGTLVADQIDVLFAVHSNIMNLNRNRERKLTKAQFQALNISGMSERSLKATISELRVADLSSEQLQSLSKDQVIALFYEPIWGIHKLDRLSEANKMIVEQKRNS